MKKLRIGFVGVGNWATQLRDVFAEQEQVEIWGHSRNSSSRLARYKGFGERYDWKELCQSSDLVVVAATPEPTTEVALWCAEHCIPVLATKPLLRHPRITVAPFFVDLWRFWSPPCRVMKEVIGGSFSRMLGRTITHLEIDFHGVGPYRTNLNGLDDWGPHALAFLTTILGITNVPDFSNLQVTHSTDGMGELHTLCGMLEGVKVRLMTGNASLEPKRCVRVIDSLEDIHTLTEKDGEIVYQISSIDPNKPTGYLRSSKEETLGLFARTILRTTRDFLQDGTIHHSITYIASYLAGEMIAKMKGQETTGICPATSYSDTRLN